MKFAFFDGNGRVAESHNDATVTQLPVGAIELTDEQWDDRFNLRLSGDSLTHDPSPFIVNDAKLLAAMRMKKACSGHIVAGIDYDGFHYPTTRDDQADINGLFSRSKELGVSGEPYKFMCADTNGAWARRNHTAAQIQALGLAVSQHVIDAKDKLDTKLAEIDAVANLPAPTQADFDAIVW